ncbi:hypothetical protein ALC62_01524 [Cyphomyrmex costatus]|uniref:ISXO2-like transposase domain-containing protein n=1 Tax=Cyphomyrmex costatus TaxID=456900 RepID=A0A195D348_9HYME|nr:hypothetical protein ALC62_01524 [Cyphomyrmex costatus]
MFTCRKVRFVRNIHKKRVRKLDTGLSLITVIDWVNFYREVCVYWAKKHTEKLEGPEHIVEIDEAKFGHRKYNRGRKVEGAVPSHKELRPGRDAKRRDVVHRVDSVGTERRAGIVYCESSINPPPSPISSRIHPVRTFICPSLERIKIIVELASASGKRQTVVRPRGVERLSVKSRQRAVSSKRRGTIAREGDAIQHVEKEGRQVRRRTKAENNGLQKNDRKKRKERRKEEWGGERERESRRGTTVYKERVQTRQLRTRPKTAIKSRDKQTTNPFCRPPPSSPFMLAQSLFLPFSVMLHPTDHE